MTTPRVLAAGSLRTSARWAVALAVALLLVPVSHPLLIPVVGVPSHLMWFAHVVAVGVLANRCGVGPGVAGLVASIAFVAGGEVLFGAGYGHPADMATVLALTVAVGAVDVLMLGFALWVRASEQRGRRAAGAALAALEAAPDAMLLLDEAGQVAMANRAAAQLLGASPGELVRMPLARLLPPEALASRDGSEPLAAQRADGMVFSATVLATRIPGPDGRPSGTLLTIRDHSEQVRREQAQRRTLALAEMGEVLASVAHELNNPLTGVIGYAQVLREESGTAAEHRDLVEHLTHEAKRAAGIARRLLTLMRRGPAERRPVDLGRTIRQTLARKRPALAAYGIQVRADVPEGLPPVSADPAELEQILVNLVANAQHAMHEAHGGGELVVRMRSVGSAVEVRVEDDGPGVPAEVRDRIFEAFFTTKGPEVGTGLGLAIARRIAQGHGGDLSVEPNQPRGAVFVLRLPVTATAADASTEGSRRRVGPAGCRHVLVVDDEPAIRDVAIRALRRAGFAPTTVGTVSEAAERLSSDRSVCAVVCDLHLPDGAGRDVYAHALHHRPDLRGRFLFVTGDALGTEVRAFLQQTGEHSLPKPFELGELLGALDSMLAATQAAGR